jgi:hypothetical protein
LSTERPMVDYTLTVHEMDETGRVYITSPELIGLIIWAKPELAFADVPIAVKKLRELNARPTTPGIPARSNGDSDETVSDGPPDHGEAVADRVGEARS